MLSTASIFPYSEADPGAPDAPFAPVCHSEQR